MAAVRRRVLSLAATGCIPEHWPAPESAPASGRRILESSRSPTTPFSVRVDGSAAETSDSHGRAGGSTQPWSDVEDPLSGFLPKPIGGSLLLTYLER